ncbi:MAG: triose-phosphate isomerase [Chloroflexia bacterium]
MRVPLICGNWKCHRTVEEAVTLALAISRGVANVKGVEVAVCPPSIALAAVSERLRESPLAVGAQNAYLEEGAYTGEIAPRMLVGLCRYVILGHSERRRLFGEDDRLIRAKVQSALGWGLSPILCVGESLEENEQGQTEAVVAGQLRAALEAVEGRLWRARGGVIAYEPVWAIGTGRPCDGATASRIIAMIRSLLADLFSSDVAEGTRILYGGSVNAANIAEFMVHPEIDGALVGGASLKAEEFLGIVERTAALRVSDG